MQPLTRRPPSALSPRATAGPGPSPGRAAAIGAALAVCSFALAPGLASAQGRWIDIGSGASHTIAVEGEPQSFQRFPPFAFGTFGPGNYIYSELLPWPCGELPAADFCGGPTFVRAFYAYLETGTCPCTGVLFEPVQLELGYDQARVAALGAREEDLHLSMYDVDVGGWVDLPVQEVHTGRDVVAGSQRGHAHQYYVIQVRMPERSTWGRIKAQWGGARP